MLAMLAIVQPDYPILANSAKKESWSETSQASQAEGRALRTVSQAAGSCTRSRNTLTTPSPAGMETFVIANHATAAGDFAHVSSQPVPQPGGA